MTKPELFTATAHGKEWTGFLDARGVFWILDLNGNIQPLLNSDLTDLTPVRVVPLDAVVIEGVTIDEVTNRLRQHLNYKPGTERHRESESWIKRILTQLSASEESEPTFTLAQLQEENAKLKAHILDIQAHSTPFGGLPEDPEFVGTYLLTVGALHRALGTIGHSVAECACVSSHLVPLPSDLRTLAQVKDEIKKDRARLAGLVEGLDKQSSDYESNLVSLAEVLDIIHTTEIGE